MGFLSLFHFSPKHKTLLKLIAVLLLFSFCKAGFGQEKLKVATCQFPVTGDLNSNAQYIKKFIMEAAQNNADIVHFSEAALTGYKYSDLE